MSHENVIDLVAGDNLPVQLIKTGLNLTGYTSVTLQIDYPDTPLAKTATITDHANGYCEVAWDDDDLLEGRWPGRIIVVDGSGKKITYGRHPDSLLYFRINS